MALKTVIRPIVLNKSSFDLGRLDGYLRTVPPFATVHAFFESRDGPRN